MAADIRPKRPFRWHIAIFLAPAVLVYLALTAGLLWLLLRPPGSLGPKPAPGEVSGVVR